MKEKIQSRRAFFKNVAKGVLPILGGLMLPTSLLANVCDIEVVPQSCNASCSGLCTSCTGSC